jgi:hypothetical protein
LQKQRRHPFSSQPALSPISLPHAFFAHQLSPQTCLSQKSQTKMPFRERIKKTFRRNSSTASQNKEHDPSDLSSPLYYQPGEKIPYKYRRPVEPTHKAKLDGFSWGAAWRRKSAQSMYSPHGSRLPSRKNSEAAPGVKMLEGVRLSMGSLGEGSDVNSRSGSSNSDASRERKLASHAIHHHDFDPNRLEPIMSVDTAFRETPPSEKTVNVQQQQQSSGAMFNVDDLDRALGKVGKKQEAPSPKP